MNARAKKPRLYNAPQAGPNEHLCEWPNCTAAGEYRAPRSRDNLENHRWLCLEHVREFNASWNYYDGMSESEVEADMRRDTVWQRKTWRLGTVGHGQKAGGVHINDPFGFFKEQQQATPDYGPPLKREEKRALATMDLTLPLTQKELKARYKALVKRHHPDANNGDPKAEERIKQINVAYHILIKRFSS